MKFSVAYTFAPGLIEQLAPFPLVAEIYGKLRTDIVGGGRASYTLRNANRSDLKHAVATAHAHHIAFNYLINAATLDGLEQTRSGQRRLRQFLDFLSDTGVDAVTVASPYLLRLVKSRYAHLRVRVGVFALIDTALKAVQWEEMGADTLCLSAIGCNRNVGALASIRKAVTCDLQLIVNASCLPGCSHELTHMNLLSRSSRSTDPLRGFGMDYCFLHCSARKLRDPQHYIRSTWIRPEDLHLYEALGYDNFNRVERSCPLPLLIKRVKAYSDRSFEGNLLDIAGPVAQITRAAGQSFFQRLRMLLTFARPDLVKISAMLHMKQYAENLLCPDNTGESAPVYIDNKALDGFLEGLLKQECSHTQCVGCTYCAAWAQRVVRIDPDYREKMLSEAGNLDAGLLSGSHWE